MKSKISLFNKAVWKRNLTGYWGLWAGLLLAALLMLPLSAYYQLRNVERYWDLGDELKVILMNKMASSPWQMDVYVPYYALTAVIAAMAVFSYLFTARNSNMMHTFPVSRVSLFITNYVSGLLFLIVPQAIGGLTAQAVGAAFGALSGETVKSWLSWLGVMSLENVFFFSAAVCMIMFVGNMAAVPVLYFIMNFLYQGCRLIAGAMLSTVCFGLESLDRDGSSILTPILAMRNIGIHSPGYSDEFESWFSGLDALLIYAAAAAVFTGIALAAYQKKHVETAGDVITVGWLKPIFRWGTAVCVSALGALFISSMLYSSSFTLILFSAVVIGAAVFFLVQMLLERSVHVFTKKRVRECILYTAVVYACYIGLDADLLGLEKKVPAADEVRSVSVGAGGNALYTEDAAEILWVQDIHRQIIASKQELERSGSSNSSTYMGIAYHLKDGSGLSRHYWIPDSSEAGSISGQVASYAKKPEVVLRRYFGIHYPDVEVYGGTLETVYYSESGAGDLRIPEADAKRLYQAFIKDVQAGHLPGSEDDSNHLGATSDTTYGFYGYLFFNVRDDAGFRSPSYNYDGIIQKDGQADILLNPSYTHLNHQLVKMGYISQDYYDEQNN